MNAVGLEALVSKLQSGELNRRDDLKINIDRSCKDTKAKRYSGVKMRIHFESDEKMTKWTKIRCAAALMGTYPQKSAILMAGGCSVCILRN